MLSEWQSSIAQADGSDWVTVAAYLIAAVISVRAAGHAKRVRQPRDAIFWRSSAVLLVLLGINELLDLQTLLTSLGRAHAETNGWYGERRRVQYAFVLALGVAAVFATIAMLWLTKRAHSSIRMALTGFGIIGLFILLRAASFNHLDDLLGGGAPQFNWGSVQEMVGILIAAFAAAIYTRRLPEGAK